MSNLAEQKWTCLFLKQLYLFRYIVFPKYVILATYKYGEHTNEIDRKIFKFAANFWFVVKKIGGKFKP